MPRLTLFIKKTLWLVLFISGIASEVKMIIDPVGYDNLPFITQMLWNVPMVAWLIWTADKLFDKK